MRFIPRFLRFCACHGTMQVRQRDREGGGREDHRPRGSVCSTSFHLVHLNAAETPACLSITRQCIAPKQTSACYHPSASTHTALEHSSVHAYCKESSKSFHVLSLHASDDSFDVSAHSHSHPITLNITGKMTSRTSKR